MDGDRDPLDALFNGLESHAEEDNHETEEEWIDHDNWDEEETVQDGSEENAAIETVNVDVEDSYDDVSQDEVSGHIDELDESEDEVSEVPSFLGDSFVTSTGIKKNQGIKTYSSGLSPITEASSLFCSPITRDLRSQESHSQV